MAQQNNKATMDTKAIEDMLASPRARALVRELLRKPRESLKERASRDLAKVASQYPNISKKVFVAAAKVAWDSEHPQGQAECTRPYLVFVKKTMDKLKKDHISTDKPFNPREAMRVIATMWEERDKTAGAGAGAGADATNIQSTSGQAPNPVTENHDMSDRVPEQDSDDDDWVCGEPPCLPVTTVLTGNATASDGEESESDDEDLENSGEMCEVCHKTTNAATMLLCDGVKCNKGYHMSCIGLTDMPMERRWYCNQCITSSKRIGKKRVRLDL